MKHLGDYTAEFKRGKDKRPRKRRDTQAIATTILNSSRAAAVGYGLGGIADYGRQQYRARVTVPKVVRNDFIQTGKMTDPMALARKYKLGNTANVAATAIGAGVGLGAYGAYRYAKSRKRGRK